MIGLYRAILRFDPQKYPVFKSFAALCIRRQIIDAVRKSNSGKNYALNTYISLEDSGPLASGAGENPEERLIGEETYLEVIERSKNLSKLERLILERYLSGKTYAEIAAEITGGEKSVDNALQRIRKKLKVEN
jgi:RNA polymerase sporulation-specific sigma factor